MEKATRCPKGTRKNKKGECVSKTDKTKSNSPTTNQTKKRSPSPSKKVVSKKEIEGMAKEVLQSESVIKIPTLSIACLHEKIHQKSPEEFRQIARKNELYIPLEEYTDDKEMLLYLVREIMELAINGTRDAKKKTVTKKKIDQVIENDHELSLLFA